MTRHTMSSALGPTPPLRGEDLPYDDGEPMESQRHHDQMNLLIGSLRSAWHDRHDFYVAGNMAVYFSETQARAQDFRAPDFFAVLDTDDRERRSWVVWEEDGRVPDLIVEIVSESTEHVDRGLKKDVYARLRVPSYVLFDPFSARLDAFRLDASGRRYEPAPTDARGFVRCAPLGLFLGVVSGVYGRVEAPWLRFIDDEGQVLLDDSERAVQERARAAQEGARAEREAERAEREAERAEREAERAEREAERAEREAARADLAVAELAALREQLAKRPRES